MRLLKIASWGWVIAALLAPVGLYGEDTKPSTDLEMLQQVSARIFAAAQQLDEFKWPADYAWPPVVVLDPGKDVNAFSSRGDWIDRDGKQLIQPKITFYQGYMDLIAKGDDGVVGQVMGHEFTHILLRHIDHGNVGAPLLADAISREQETAADVLGFKIALKAGYPYAKLIDSYKRLKEWARSVNSDYNTYEGFNADHPATSDRIAQLDSIQPELARSTSAFETGVEFLLFEQYPLAARCFGQITREMPGCYEAWANLGYTKLMMYCDKLSPEDLQNYDIGYLVTGGFYREAQSLERGIDEQLWYDAFGALREAVRLKPDAVLPKATMAIAYLVHPKGKDVGGAEQLFQEVLTAINSGNVEALDPAAKAALLVNAGVAEMSAGHSDQSQALFDQATKLLADAKTSSGQVNDAVRYNHAFQLARASADTDTRQAVTELNTFLSTASDRGLWWPLAYDRYSQLCKQLNIEARPQTAFARKHEKMRHVLTLTLPDDKTIAVSDLLSDVQKLLGPGSETQVIRRTNVVRVWYADRGLQLIATDRVLAICVGGSAAPPVTVEGTGLDGAKHLVRVGMTLAEFEKLLGKPSNLDEREFLAPREMYRYYPDIGIGVKVDHRTITEILIAPLPAELSSS